MKTRIDINDEIYLTEVLETDCVSLVKYLNDEQIAANTLMIPYPYTEADADFFINLCNDNKQKHQQIVNWAIRNEHGEMIGGIGRMMKSDMGSTHKDEIGYWLGKPFREMGIMTKVVKGFCDYLNQNCGVLRVEAVIFPQNLASMKVVEKAGFEREAYCRKYHVTKGVPIDKIMYVKIS